MDNPDGSSGLVFVITAVRINSCSMIRMSRFCMTNSPVRGLGFRSFLGLHMLRDGVS